LIFSPFLNDIWVLPKATILWFSIPLFIHRGKFSFKKEQIPIYLWIFIFFVCAVFSPSKILSFFGNYRYYFHGFLSTFAGFCVFLLAKELDFSQHKKIFSYFLLALAISSVAGIFLQYPERISATFGNPNFFGGVLSMTIPFVIFLSLSEGKYTVFAFIFLLALFFTLSRASWVGTFVGILFLFVFLKDKKVLKFFLTASLILAVLTLIFSFSSFQEIFKRFLSIFNLREADIVSRFEGYFAALEILKKHPVFGKGPETFLLFFRAYAPVSFVQKIGTLAHAGYPHCYFLQILVDFGLFGFGIFSLFVFSVFKKALISKNPFKIAALSSVVAHIFTNLFAFPSITEILLFWFFVGIIFSGQKATAEVKNKTLRSVFAVFVLLFTLIPLYTDFVFRKASALPPQKALKIYKKMIFPQDYHLMNTGRRIIDLYHQTGDERWLGEAEGFFRKILARNPYSALALNGMGFVWKERFEKDKSKESFNRAKNFFTKALSVDPFLEAVYLNYGKLCEDARLFEEEIEIYKRGLEIYPENEKFLFNLGVAYANSGNLKEAVFLWNKLKSVNPDYPKLKEYLKKAEFLLGKR